MKAANTLVLALVLLVAAVGAWFFVFDDNARSDPAPIGNEQPAQLNEPAGPQAGERRTTEVAEATTPRAPLPPPRREVVQSTGTDFQQGIEGRLVDDLRAPVVGAEVFLFEGQGANIFANLIDMQRGIEKPPLASGTSDENGVFRLGIESIPPGRVFELRAVSPYHADVLRPNLTLFEGRWWDAGDIEMRRGLTVLGRVTQAETGMPVADASVFLKPQTYQLTNSPTPGRERGVEVRTDVAGNYRFDNASVGICALTAVAPGYAQVELTSVNIKADVENRFDFELPPGKSIGGVVTDGEGNPIAGAVVDAHAISSKSPLSVQARTGTDGRFELIGLVDSPFQLNVTALGYVPAKADAVLAGTEDEHIVMETQCSVRVMVVASNNRRITNFAIDVKNWVATQQSIGNLPQIPRIRVRERDLDRDGYYTLSGLNPGNYKLEINAGPGFSKNFSEPIDLRVGEPAPEVVVRLGEGGSITGVVLAANGQPLPDVLVKTQPNAFEDNALSDMFAPLIPFEITKAEQRTGADGRFRLERLYPGTYQLQFSHADHYAQAHRGIVVQEGADTDIGTIYLQRGTLVYGTVLVDGAPAAQVKVTVSSVPDPDRPTTSFTDTAVTNENGEFVLQKRLPPGRYTGQAGRQGAPTEIFNMVLDYQRTRREFQVGPGQEQYELHFQIQTNAPIAPPVQPGGR
ncbi:MAG: carboxypeptidase regulatory-like domain-containing protein [Planctomycetes bacterium]|nr:carboxypeptidase regulatory-like domain-containing protein [Planctomycetota bacterium]